MFLQDFFTAIISVNILKNLREEFYKHGALSIPTRAACGTVGREEAGQGTAGGQRWLARAARFSQTSDGSARRGRSLELTLAPHSRVTRPPSLSFILSLWSYWTSGASKQVLILNAVQLWRKLTLLHLCCTVPAETFITGGEARKVAFGTGTREIISESFVLGFKSSLRITKS